ncbi:spermidine/putrescine transport system substrate-binding protein [Azospirillum lipoferum]|uniref:Spermidine/putrescine ABC transporter substrate-binding protein n=1 Tax=Azospirillum lipoferum TaxID=193 RepID=A0A5A9GP43_AZOLI|nr:MULTISPECIES: spermidine/putrescine ABC transporter substrate-binding protein [Azospirillum]KAA0596123.1 spermidine/putrescine ABC transporter substrate-binding protein [Azospirillum lipoferum]MCP1611070.1 spermidine/putrescine transport system substrate-binding protein [Azospirillum lipoferum]MDW5533803.1 spermidine/putrescine ABC transporter substrate-binding protein [Azospirillum sp. NL1]
MNPALEGALARRLLSSIAVLSLGAMSAMIGTAPAAAQTTLNALVWCDHTDPALIEPFEKANNVKVNLKEYEGTGTALSIISQSRPGDWDVLVIDGVDVQQAVDKNILGELPAGTLPTADIFPEVRMEANNTRNGKTYAVTEKFGYNTVSYDKAKVDPADMRDMSKLWSDTYKGRIAVYDYYLPMIGLTGIALGKATADLKEADLPAIRSKLFDLKKNAKQVSDVVSSQTALATGEVDIVFGGGEWLTAGLVKDKPNLDWVIPDQGAVRWAQSIGVMKDSTRKELALKFVQYIVSPEGQARLATSACYWAMPANQKAGALLTETQKTALRWNEQADYLKKTQLYPIPTPELDAKMQDAWTEMLQK